MFGSPFAVGNLREDLEVRRELEADRGSRRRSELLERGLLTARSHSLGLSESDPTGDVHVVDFDFGGGRSGTAGTPGRGTARLSSTELYAGSRNSDEWTQN